MCACVFFFSVARKKSRKARERRGREAHGEDNLERKKGDKNKPTARGREKVVAVVVVVVVVVVSFVCYWEKEKTADEIGGGMA